MPEPSPGDIILETRGATARFGTFTAVDAATYTLRKGETVGIIGPNGAGKSTFFNLITGLVPPAAGTVHLSGLDVTGCAPHERVRRGLVRTFQLVSVFDALPALDNLVLAAIRADPSLARGRRFLLGSSRRPELLRACSAALEHVGLAAKAELPAAELSYGDKRMLEIALALTLRPRVLLLDEPFAGLSDVEIAEVLGLVRRIQGTLSIVIIEHKISYLVDLASRLSVMHEGRFIAEGKPSEVLADATVRQVYWGGEGRGLTGGASRDGRGAEA
ncbi:MAG TPA: ABC transporter ATP-binding protein [Anaeromyxobacter sp.]